MESLHPILRADTCAYSLKIPSLQVSPAFEDFLRTVGSPWIRSTNDAAAAVPDTIQMIVPMKTQNKLRGFLLLSERMGSDPYSDSETSFLHALADRTISALENARLFRSALEKERMEDRIGTG